MSDTQMTDDPILEHLYARKGTLVEKLRETNTRLSEIDELIEVIRDGRSRVNRQRKARTAGNSSAADGQGPLPDPMRAEDAV